MTTKRFPCGLFEDQTCSRSPCTCRNGQWFLQGVPVVPTWPVIQQPGCICPPGANKDCENRLCPRKNYVPTATGGRAP